MGKRKSIRMKILLPTAIVIVIISIVMGLTAYQSIYNGMLSMGSEEAEMAAKAAEGTIDAELLKDIVPNSEQTEAYQKLLGDMRKVQSNYGIKYLYTLYSDGKKVYYGVDTDNTADQMSVGEEFEVSYDRLKSVFAGENYKEQKIDYSSEDGALISVYRAIRDENGKVVGVLGCDYDADSIVERLNKTVLKTIAVCLLCMVISLLLIGWIVQNIMNSLKIVDRKIADLVDSDGDLSKQLEVHTGDELEDIANHVNIVLGHIYEQANIAKQVADGNLTVKVVPKSENDLLGNALNHLVKRNLNVLLGIKEAARQAKDGSSQMADASEMLAQGTTEQAAAIEQITASISNVSEQTKKNAHDANNATALISHAIETVEQGNENMISMMSAMNDISKVSEGISKINKAIDDIAFQTNILALNAEVEAARAGEAGRGFSVVAEEVRNLARKSAAAAAESSALIEDAISKTMIGAGIAGEMKHTLEAITEAVSQSVEMINEIAESSNAQMDAIGQIDTSIDQVSKALQTNSSASQQCAVSSAKLLDQMVAVDKMLDVYQLKE